MRAQAFGSGSSLQQYQRRQWRSVFKVSSKPPTRATRRNATTKSRTQLQVRAGPVEINDDDLLQHPDRIKWYETKFCADDMPDWNAARFVSSQQMAPNLRNVVLECEISRERVPLRNAYMFVGQKAAVRVEGGLEHQLTIASAPFAQALNKEPLFRVRGDIYANETKAVKEPITVMAELHLLVSKEEAPEVYNLAEGDALEVGPFQGAGLDLKGSPLSAMYMYPTLVLLVEGRGIAHARALLESADDGGPGLMLRYRRNVRMYYKAPNDASVCYKDRFEAWAQAGCQVVTTTRDLQQAFDDDDTFAYEPERTGAIILTGGDEAAEAQALKVAKEAEIGCVLCDSQQQTVPEYLSSTPTSFLRWASNTSGVAE